ncbi:hypothetical protein Vretimale_15509 [Volvox reticuliferus]|uniref:RNA polymerase sigma-70 region 2 domain-containing protein n=1 Tax=Volvox reticuliferus TaxID=1737510 RepID=A0A8J4CNU1_9CHLO|nr:hypothetical protein Vretifemale_15163 [Volvox reticuliferus]GIM12076.1 hypothetical protein Vretimale_15509 [Volvox reticuliferus]
MLGCKLQGIGCESSQRITNGRSWASLPVPCRTLRRTDAVLKSTVSVADVRSLDSESPASHLRPSTRDFWSSASETLPSSATSSPGPPASTANGAVVRLLRASQAADIQKLSAEISRLVTELDTELNSFLASANPTMLPQQQKERQQQKPHVQPQPTSSFQPHVESLRIAAATAGAQRRPPGNGSGGATASAFDPLALASTSPPVNRHTGLQLLSLSRPAAGLVDAAIGSVAGAGSRAERRRQNWRRGAAAMAASMTPDHEPKFKANGTGSISILMGSFSKDHILSAEEEQLLAAAAQDFMQLSGLRRVLTTVLRRPPSMAEMAKSLHCDEASLRVRLDCGNRARTLLAQKNYRLVVNIAKRLARPASAAGGSLSGAGSSSAPVGDGGVSLDDAITVGMEALMYAIRKFKPEAGYRLSTYATWWIRLHVSRLVQAQTGVISLPVYQRANLDRLRAVRAQLRSKLPPGVAPSIQELAEAAGMYPSQVAQLEAIERAFTGGTRSFEAPLADGEGERGLTVEDLVAQDNDAELPLASASSLFLDSEDFAASASFSSTVEGLLSSLDRRESELLRRQYGLDDEVEMEPGEESEEGNSEEVATATEVGKAGAASGAQRLKLGRKRRTSVAQALEKLRLLAGEDSHLAEWLQLDSAKASYATRAAAGYAKKSKG